MILYGIELKEIKKRDEGLDDIGKYAICNDNFDNKQPVKINGNAPLKKLIIQNFSAFLLHFLLFLLLLM